MELPQAGQLAPERFEIERRLGAGGFGSVFVVFDRERQQRLALKRLERVDPASIYRFKQEFRALADVTHPNLVKLHELFALPTGWSFTMELIAGVPFDEWVLGASNDQRLPTSELPTQPDCGPTQSSATPSHVTVSASRPLPTGHVQASFDEGRLRDALAQLALGVAALHGEGILHRDLKPSNVLVDHGGRVVILDFGMVATGVVDSHQSADGNTVGTPAYMSPEQARGAPLTVASDWYTVGLMLYEGLTGHLPFSGTAADILVAKATREPRHPRAYQEGLPDDLAELCMELLKRDPSARPTGHEVLRRLDVEVPSATARKHTLLGAFVGRELEQDRLRQAFAASRRGNTVVAHVHGPSGHGKSTLIKHFLNQLSLHDEVVILDGRCYERESVPFKALDDLVDALYRYLRRLRPVEAATFMPRHAQALVRLFPTLGRLDFMAELPAKPPPSDPHELRRKAFSALREMFARLTDSRPVVLFIDDVQWGDSDSAALFRDLLAPPDVPPLLLLLGYRGDSVDENELLRTLRSPMAADTAWDSVDVPLGPLTPRDAVELAGLLLGPNKADEELARTIADESGGSPLFVAELVRRSRSGNDEGEVTLQHVVAGRVAQLPESARALLELMACSERPLDQRELERCSKLDSSVTMNALDQLREEHLVNVSTTRGRAAFEIFHDKMRLAVQSGIDQQRLQQCHHELANALAEMGQTDPETLAHHYTAAGDARSAREWLERAADRATEGVAFEHAVTLFRRALSLAEPEQHTRIGQKLAEALARAGRGAESAEAYLLVARTKSGDEATTLRQAAAEQYLRAGHVEEALATFGPLLQDAGLALPSTPTRALLSLLWRRTLLKWRGLEFEERQITEADKEEVRAIDFCWSVGTGLAGLDLVRSARYHVISLQMSLKLGDPYRIARSLSIEAIMKALESTEGVALATKLSDKAFAIAERIDNAHALGWATAGKAVVAWGNTDLPRCLQLSDQAIGYLRQRSLETFREIGSMQVWFALNSMFLMGDLKQLAGRAPACAREAAARGDRYTLSTVRGYVLPLLWASRDRVEQGRKEADEGIAVWPKDIWYHQHWAWLRAHCFLDLYEGNGAKAFERATSHRENMKRALQLRVRTLRSELNYLEGRGAVDVMLTEGNTTHRKLVCERIKDLYAERNDLADIYAMLLEAGLVASEDGVRSRVAFAEVAAKCDQLHMPMHAAASTIREGQCLGSDTTEGRQLVEAGIARLRDHGVTAPEHFADMLVPRVEVAR